MINDLNYYISVKKQDVSQEIVSKPLKSSIRKESSENPYSKRKCHCGRKGCMVVEKLLVIGKMLLLEKVKATARKLCFLGISLCGLCGKQRVVLNHHPKAYKVKSKTIFIKITYM